MENQPITVMARLIAKPGMEKNVKYALKPLIIATRKEPGCLSYNFYQSSYDSRVFLSHEVWESHEVFAKHLLSPYIIALQEQGEDLLVQPLEVTFVEALA
ncbi:MAG: putative quinol monooxygenase [Blastocatellia bacterium]